MVRCPSIENWINREEQRGTRVIILKIIDKGVHKECGIWEEISQKNKKQTVSIWGKNIPHKGTSNLVSVHWDFSKSHGNYSSWTGISDEEHGSRRGCWVGIRSFKDLKSHCTDTENCCRAKEMSSWKQRAESRFPGVTGRKKYWGGGMMAKRCKVSVMHSVYD